MVIFLALRDERLIGAGETVEDARRLCEDESARRGQGRLQWDARRVRDLTEDDGRGQIVATAARYAVRRVPVARFGGERQ